MHGPNGVNDAHFHVRRNGKVFVTNISPSYFVNSPLTTEKFLIFRDLLDPLVRGSAEPCLSNVYDWVVEPLKQHLIDLAPPPEGPVQVSLKEHFFPDYIIFNLDAVDEKLVPRRVLPEKLPVYSFGELEEAFLDSLPTWTTIYDHSDVILSFTKPEDALFKRPRKVFIKNGEVECYFKMWTESKRLIRELKCYQAIAAAGLDDSQSNICKLHGVVMDHRGHLMGILLSYITGNKQLADLVNPYVRPPPRDVRQEWMRQLDSTLARLHEAGMVWGNADLTNVLVDANSKVWVTDFGGRILRSRPDGEAAYTIGADVADMEAIRKLLFPLPKIARYWGI